MEITIYREKIMNYYTGEKGQEYYDMRSERRDEFLQKRRAGHFQPYIDAQDTVLDFGCGTGGILAHLNCTKKIGIEVNAPSILEAKARGLEIHEELSTIADQSIDVVISYHALEHVLSPSNQITKINCVLKSSGKAILIVPSESPANIRFSKWNVNDPDHHLHSWTPLSFANLIAECGFDIEKSWRSPIGYSKYIRPLANINEALFQMARRATAATLDRYEIITIAKKR